MKPGKRLIIPAVVVCIAFIYLARHLADESSSTVGSPAANQNVTANEISSGQQSTQITAFPVGNQTNAAEQIEVLRQSHQRVEKNLDTVLMLTEAQAEQNAELNNRRSAEMEKDLVDSMTSLTKLLVNEPGSTTSAIEMLSIETDPQLMILIAQSLGEAAAVMGKDFPYDLLADIAANDPNNARREAALLALSYMKEVPDDLHLLMTEISQAAPTPEIRAAAVDVMGQWVNNNPQLANVVSESLLLARENNDHPLVRGMVIQTIGNSEMPLTPKVFDAMNDALRTETVAGNRALAAVAMGSGASTDNRQSVIEALDQAYRAEQNLETKRHIITQIAKAAQDDAAVHLQRLPTPYPLLRQDVNDFVEIMASGNASNWGEVWQQKSDRNNQRGTYPGAHGGHGTDSPDGSL